MEKKTSNTQTRDNIELICELLYELGSPSAVAKHLNAPVSQIRRIAEQNKDFILDMVQTELALTAPKAVKTLRDSLDDDGSVPKGDIRLKGAESILDRVGASKKANEDKPVQHTPIILMPVKETVVVPPIKVVQHSD